MLILISLFVIVLKIDAHNHLRGKKLKKRKKEKSKLDSFKFL